MRLFCISLSALLLSFSLSIANPLKDPDLDSRPNQWVPYLDTYKVMEGKSLVLHPYAGLPKQKDSIARIRIHNDMVRENFHVGLNDEMFNYFDNNVLMPGFWMIKLYDDQKKESMDIGVIQATFEGYPKKNVVLNILTHLNERYYDVSLNSIKSVIDFIVEKTAFRHFEMQAIPGNESLIKALTELDFTKKSTGYATYEHDYESNQSWW